jgi:hypothetical protein
MKRHIVRHFAVTQNALAFCEQHNLHPGMFVSRHLSGDWGNLSDDDKAINERACDPAEKGRIMSSYEVVPGQKVWVITDAGWDVCTVLLPDDY